VLFATTNKGKLAEVIDDLHRTRIKVKVLGDQYPPDPDLEETGETFMQNAILKALHYSKKFAIPTLADDSGLVIPAMDNLPGVHSSRYLGEDSSYAEKMAEILKNLNGKTGEERNAYFACAMALAFDGRIISKFEKKIIGSIAEAPSGDSGFGYDPIFLSHQYNKTFAELNQSQKNKYSHRGQALKTFIQLVETHTEIRDILTAD
jgi:XTP/dITP diphosphohydrolase